MGQDHRGLMYFATKAGVLQFDGRSWDLLRRTAAVYSLQITPEGGKKEKEEVQPSRTNPDAAEVSEVASPAPPRFRTFDGKGRGDINWFRKRIICEAF